MVLSPVGVRVCTRVIKVVSEDRFIYISLFLWYFLFLQKSIIISNQS